MMTKTTMTKKIMTALLAIVVAIGFTVTIPSTANAEDGLDMAGATKLSLGKPYWGTAETTYFEEGYSETYSFETTGNDSFYNIFLTNSTYGGGLRLNIYDADGVKVDSIGYVSADVHKKDYCSAKLQPNKKYYARVSADYYRTAKGEYKLEINEIKDDAGDDNYKAKSLSLDKLYNARLDTGYDSDWYKFTAKKTGTYKVSVTKKSENDHIDLYFYNADVVKEDSFSLYNRGSNNQYSKRLKAGQTYYVEAVRYYTDDLSQNPYSIKVISPKIAKPSKVDISLVKAGKKSLTVKFKRAKNATKYRVAVKAKSAKKWKYYTSKKLTKKITKLKTGKKYNVKVQGVRVVGGKSYYGKWSKIKTVKVK